MDPRPAETYRAARRNHILRELMTPWNSAYYYVRGRLGRVPKPREPVPTPEPKPAPVEAPAKPGWRR